MDELHVKHFASVNPNHLESVKSNRKMWQLFLLNWIILWLVRLSNKVGNIYVFRYKYDIGVAEAVAVVIANAVASFDAVNGMNPIEIHVYTYMSTVHIVSNTCYGYKLSLFGCLAYNICNGQTVFGSSFIIWIITFPPQFCPFVDEEICCDNLFNQQLTDKPLKYPFNRNTISEEKWLHTSWRHEPFSRSQSRTSAHDVMSFR